MLLLSSLSEFQYVLWLHSLIRTRRHNQQKDERLDTVTFKQFKSVVKQCNCAALSSYRASKLSASPVGAVRRANNFGRKKWKSVFRPQRLFSKGVHKCGKYGHFANMQNSDGSLQAERKSFTTRELFPSCVGESELGPATYRNRKGLFSSTWCACRYSTKMVRNCGKMPLLVH